MVAAVLVLVALVAPSPREPDIITVTLEKSNVVLVVYPPKGRTVKSVRLQQRVTIGNAVNLQELHKLCHSIPKPVGPRSTKALMDRGLRATFTRPPGKFSITITLDDGSKHGVDDQGRRTNSKKRTVGGHWYVPAPARGN
jgi:hypothetical protein